MIHSFVSSKKARLAAVLAASAMCVGVAAAPAQAQPVVTGGLINVTIVDAVDVNRVQVALPISAAANVCNVDVAVLSALVADSIENNETCTADSSARGTNRQ